MTVLTHDRVKTIPHESDFQTLKKWQIWYKSTLGLLLICAVLQLASIGIQSDSPIPKIEDFDRWVKISNYLIFILIPIFFILEIVCNRYYIAAEYTRRKVFIDNSFGSKLAGMNSIGYFSNDNQTPNFYKAAINTFESCHFTYHISCEMLKSAWIKNGSFALVFLCVAYFGADKNTFVVTIFQGMLSGYFLKNLIDAYYFNSRAGEILEDFKVFFNGLIHKEFAAADVPISLKLIMDYETNLAYGTFKSDSGVYHKLNDSLSNAWEDMKAYYGLGAKYM